MARTKRQPYTGVNYKLVMCRCGERYACKMVTRDDRPYPDRIFTQDGNEVSACLNCGRIKFVAIQQLHPGGKFLNGNPCGCLACRDWAQVIG